LHGCDGGFVRLLIARTSLAHLTISQACSTPHRQAIFGWGWWTFNGHASIMSRLIPTEKGRDRPPTTLRAPWRLTQSRVHCPRCSAARSRPGDDCMHPTSGAAPVSAITDARHALLVERADNLEGSEAGREQPAEYKKK
jgi:hypothetical protein